jgi:ABC-type Fe3+ transport system permease subunit
MISTLTRTWPLWVLFAGFYFPVGISLYEDFLAGDVSEAAAGFWAALPLLVSTAFLVLVSALLATSVGAIDALVFSTYRRPYGAFFWLLPGLLMTFTTPPAAVASAIQASLGSSLLIGGARDEVGTILLLTLRWMPVAFLVLSGLSLTIPLPQEQALRMLPPGKAFRLRWQLQKPWRRGCFLLLFLLMLPAAEIPSYTGVETIGRRIMARLTIGDGLSGWWLAAGMALLVLPGIIRLLPKEIRWGRSFQVMPVQGLPEAAWTRVWWAIRLLPVGALLLVLGKTAWPQASLAPQATAEFLAALWAGFREVPRALLVVSIAFACCWALAQNPRRRSLLLWCLPTLLPGSLVGLALATAVRPWIPFEFDRFPILLSLAQVVQLGGLAVMTALLSLWMIPEAEMKSAMQVPPGAARWRILLPRSMPVLLPAGVLGMLLILGEVQSTLLLAPPGHPSPALELHQLLHFRNDEQAARLALAMVVISFLWTWLFSALVSREGGTVER